MESAKNYFRDQLCKSSELAFSIAHDPALDREIEIVGAKQFALKMQGDLAQQYFSPDVRSDAERLLKCIDPGATSKLSEAFRFACTAVLRARIENAKLHAEQLAGNYAVTSSDPLFTGVFALPPIPGDQPQLNIQLTFEDVANRFVAFKKPDWAPKTAADYKRVIALGTEMIGATTPMKSVDTDAVKRVRDVLYCCRRTI
ncbi:hypothetical protein QA640_04485 [Bradyrhizobium sp. CB82]|uniref:hypothetical protein n=1 Tax=Bradyrhizobium sp. CB82 TaxID=3039159 RepID=UPI0024B13DB9|nr:hypothetical protein [Bradyrhizobium sp. CB82]WFU41777.1 hypothetical protein QA640_04485 [Bradyrhizobium sp. CB82]